MARNEFDDMHLEDKIFDILYHMVVADVWDDDSYRVPSHTLQEEEQNDWYLTKDDICDLAYEALKQLSEDEDPETYIFKCLFAAHYYELAEFTDDDYYEDDEKRDIKLVPKYDMDINIGNELCVHVWYNKDEVFIPGMTTSWDTSQGGRIFSILVEFWNNDSVGSEYLNFSYCIKVEDYVEFRVKLSKLIH